MDILISKKSFNLIYQYNDILFKKINNVYLKKFKQYLKEKGFTSDSKNMLDLSFVCYKENFIIDDYFLITFFGNFEVVSISIKHIKR